MGSTCKNSKASKLIVENGVAMEIARDGKGKLHRGNIAEVIKDVIFGEHIWEDLRRKMKSLGEYIRYLREKEMNEVVEVITQLCEKNQSKNAFNMNPLLPSRSISTHAKKIMYVRVRLNSPIPIFGIVFLAVPS
ncbi:hypothetical protein RND71_028930 [Anisodus tanguticus]|uniref:Uncharacterized protein n=1 Tax=Anisodus tanguticus TaxID=243964 RepID=A0AAE1RLW6_9SOLA|nr:hypothetical protein RND71_028930 [Anisodus tanguticus]